MDHSYAQVRRLLPWVRGLRLLLFLGIIILRLDFVLRVLRRTQSAAGNRQPRITSETQHDGRLIGGVESVGELQTNSQMTIESKSKSTKNDLKEAYLPGAGTDARDEKQSAYWYVKILYHVLVRALDEVIVQAPREALSRTVIGRRLIVILQRRDRRYGEFATED